MASRIEIIRASNSDGPAPLSACLSAAIAPVATSISPATMIPLNIVHPVMEAGAPPASGLKFRTKQKAQARCRLGRDRKSVVEGKSVSVRLDIGGRRIIKKKKVQSKHEVIDITYNNYTTKKY